MLRSRLFHNGIPLSLLLLFLVFPSASTAQDDSQSTAVDLLQSVSRRLWGIDQSSTITLIEKDLSDSTRTRRFRLHIHYPQPADSILKQTFMEVVAPEKLAGQKYWLWMMSSGRERTWIYMPRIGRLQEIQHRQGNRSRNRELDLSELNITAEQIESHTHQLLESSLLNGIPVVLIKSTEKGTAAPPQEQHPDYKLLWIDSEHLLVRKAEIYSGRGKLVKRFTVEAAEQINGFTIATSILIWDAKRKQETQISVDGLSLAPDYDPGLFQPVAD